MKRFHFTLEALHILRKRQEQVALEIYGQAVTARQRTIDHLRDAWRRCEEAWALSRERTATGAPAAHLAQLRDYCQAMDELKKRCESALEQAQRVVDTRWKELMVARQAREAVEKFLQRQRDRHNRAALREEQKALDDMAGRRLPLATPKTLNLETEWS